MEDISQTNMGDLKNIITCHFLWLTRHNFRIFWKHQSQLMILSSLGLQHCSRTWIINLCDDFLRTLQSHHWLEYIWQLASWGRFQKTTAIPNPAWPKNRCTNRWTGPAAVDEEDDEAVVLGVEDVDPAVSCRRNWLFIMFDFFQTNKG
jgi:hypothetical protein